MMILSCSPAVGEWNASEDMMADTASNETNCALECQLHDTRVYTAYRLGQLHTVHSLCKVFYTNLDWDLKLLAVDHYDDCNMLSTASQHTLPRHTVDIECSTKTSSPSVTTASKMATIFEANNPKSRKHFFIKAVQMSNVTVTSLFISSAHT